MHVAYEHSRGREVSPGAASWARILEQGLALEELVEMNTSIRARGTRGVRWGTIATHRRCCREGCCTTIVGTFRWRRRSCTQGGWYPCGGWEAQQQLKPRDGSSIVGTLAVRSGRGFLSRTSIFVFIYRTHSTSEGWLWRQQTWGQSETRGNMSAHSAISRTAASLVHPTWGLFGRAKSRSIIAACILLLEN